MYSLDDPGDFGWQVINPMEGIPEQILEQMTCLGWYVREDVEISAHRMSYCLPYRPAQPRDTNNTP